ncbi:hypothetical protein [Flavobacterium ajazii]|uniref:hypothetical protein n=1 Tax=Flavobacterium ajazii TaxID=2692318 RepID=UPI0013D215C1|nr:hypothetical protein [Flavobacterium ajazii]
MLNKYNFIFFVFLSINFANSQVNPNEVFIRGYTRNDGTVVAPHYRTAPNNTNTDNFSTIPNINPHTLEPGYILPDSKSINIETQIYIPEYTNYYPDRNEVKTYGSYEIERLLDKIYNEQYNYGYQKHSNEIIDNYKQSHYNYDINYKELDSISTIDSSVAVVDSSILTNTLNYENPKVEVNNNSNGNKTNEVANNTSNNETDMNIFTQIFPFFFIILILRKIFR